MDKEEEIYRLRYHNEKFILRIKKVKDKIIIQLKYRIEESRYS